jgi:hypothetical protein
MKKSQNVPVWLRKNGFGCWFIVIADFGVAGKRRQQCSSPSACSKECNKHDVTSATQPFLLPPSIIMIGPSGLLICCSSFSFMCIVVAKKTKKQNLDMKNIFAESVGTEHHRWRCSSTIKQDINLTFALLPKFVLFPIFFDFLICYIMAKFCWKKPHVVMWS